MTNVKNSATNYFSEVATVRLKSYHENTNMDEQTHITHLIAEAFGEPGERTFRISAKTRSQLIYIWVEKEHLIQLSLLIFQLSERIAIKKSNESSENVESADSELSILEFKVGKIALEFDVPNQLFIIEAIEDEESGESTLVHIQSAISPETIIRFAKNALEICVAGRPSCNLCLAPIDKASKHKCPKLNGHLRFEIP